MLMNILRNYSTLTGHAYVALNCPMLMFQSSSVEILY